MGGDCILDLGRSLKSTYKVTFLLLRLNLTLNSKKILDSKVFFNFKYIVEELTLTVIFFANPFKLFPLSAFTNTNFNSDENTDQQ